MRTMTIVVAVALAACSSAATSTTTPTTQPDPDNTVQPDAPPAPVTPVAAAEYWASLGITGANLDIKLEALESEDPEMLHAMALVMLAQGGFDCRLVEGQGMCGVQIEPSDISQAALDEPIELWWADVSPTATLDDPCLRRELAIWSLERVEPGDIAGLYDVFLSLVTLPQPENDLVAGALELAKQLTDDQYMALLTAAVQANQVERADEAIASVSHELVRRAALGLHLPYAIEALDTKADVDVMLALVADDTLDTDYRILLVRELTNVGTPEVRAVLAAAAANGPCDLAMLAAEELDYRGDSSAMPAELIKAGTHDAIAQALCMSVRASLGVDISVWRRAIHPTRGLVIATETLLEQYEGDPPRDGSWSEKLTRKNVSADVFDKINLRADLQYAMVVDWVCDAKAMTCDGNAYDDLITISFARKGNVLYATKIAIERDRTEGC